MKAISLVGISGITTAHSMTVLPTQIETQLCRHSLEFTDCTPAEG